MKHLIIFLLCLISLKGNAQMGYERWDSIAVVRGGKTLKNPWAGGFNAPQFSAMDLNFDGIQDLFVFDRDGRIVKTFINGGTPDSIDYHYAPEYRASFPSMRFFTLMRDYDCDGRMDIFTQATAGMRVFRNESDASGLKFTLVKSLLYSEYGSGPVNLYVSQVDIPAIADLNGDGDLDVLAFGVFGTTIEYHENQSKELYGHCDSLVFEMKDGCWGKFFENASNNSVTLGYNCKSGGMAGEEASGAHSGSTILAIDLDADSDKEVMLGDVSFSNIVMLTNGGDSASANMIAQDTAFPSYDVPVNLPIFPAGYYIDVNNDGTSDLLVAPNADNAATVADYFSSVWHYKNTGTEKAPDFGFQTAGFLQDEMIEVSSGASPVFFDYNADGLNDLIIGNFGYKISGGNVQSRLALYRNTGTNASPSFLFVTDDYSGLSSQNYNAIYPAFGDLDGDGDMDMLLGDSEGLLHYYENTAGAGNPASFTLSASNYSGIDVGQYATPQLIDLNRDGLLDIVTGERAGNLNYFENTGTISSPLFSATPTTDTLGGVDVMVPCCTGYSTPWFFENDSGEYVLLTGSEQGKAYYYTGIEGNLSGIFTLTDSLDLMGFRVSVSGGDINGDGIGELVFGEYAGGVGVMRRTGILPPPGVPDMLGKGSDISLFPNPTTGPVELLLEGWSGDLTLQVSDLSGRVLLEKHLAEPRPGSRASMDLSGLSKGVYLLRAVSGNGAVVKKVVKL